MDSSGGRRWNDDVSATAGTEHGPAPKSDDLAPGTMVGEYQIEGRLGAGGMGVVFSAIHPVIAKRAAIKVLRPELSVDHSAVERFIQEARSVNQIGHDNIVDIFSFGNLPDGRAYFAMELLRGESLRERMAKGRLVLVDTLSILETITEALEAAHEKGIVHRDLKPDNVFLVESKSGRPIVKLLDFGIAKLLTDDSKRTSRTQTGNMLGTPAYVSPEQARGYAVDHRTDLYALGAMAFEMVTGDFAFPADNAADMIAKHLFQPPRSICAIDPHLPPALDALLVSLLAKEAAERPTLAHTRSQLQLIRESIRSRTPVPGSLVASVYPPASGSVISTAPSHRATPTTTTAVTAAKPRWPIVAGSAVAVAAIGLVAFLAGRTDKRDAAPPPARTEEPAPSKMPVVETPPPPPPATAPVTAPVPEGSAGSATPPATKRETKKGTKRETKKAVKDATVKEVTVPPKTTTPPTPPPIKDDDAPM
jgi:serine/threonine-protein kinase